MPILDFWIFGFFNKALKLHFHFGAERQSGNDPDETTGSISLPGPLEGPPDGVVICLFQSLK